MLDKRKEEPTSKETVAVADGGRELVNEIEELRGHTPAYTNMNQEEIER